jgi:hypothetical protein
MAMRFYIVVFSLVCSSLAAQVSFKTKLSRNEVSVGQRFQVEFAVNQEGTDFSPPSFQGFKVLGGPNTSYSSFRDNRGHRLEISYGYVLKAMKPGEYTIDPAFIKVNGETYRTQEVKITVHEAKQNTTSGQPDLAFLKLIASKTEVYLGEPIYGAFRIYYRDGLGLEPLSLNAEPDFEGFYNEQIEQKRIEEDIEYFNGLAYKAGNLRELVLIPQRSGKLEPGPLAIELPVNYQTNQRDSWGFPRRVRRNLDLSSSFPAITVKPLPTKGKPQNFSGAVGDFKMDASISATEVSTDGSLRLRIRIEGRGNIKFADLPQVEFPSAFEVFDPEIKESSTVGPYGMRGYKEIEYLLVPRYKGKYKIEPIVFSYFDPKKERYQRLETETYDITITGDGPVNANTTEKGISSTGNQESVDFLNQDILFIKTKGAHWKSIDYRFLGSTLFYGSLGGIFILALGLILFWNRKKKELTNRDSLRIQRAGKMARKKLQKAQKALKQGNAEVFYAELETAILGFFSDKLQVGVSSLSKEFIRTKLKEGSCAEEDIKGILDLLAKAEMARFTGIKMEAAEKDYHEAQTVLTKIEKQL